MRLQVGAIIIKDKSIVSMGYNGVAPGGEHCDTHFTSIASLENKDIETWIGSEEFKQLHHEWSMLHELHAEMNAITQAAKRGISIDEGELIITHSPCISCCKAIIHSGIKLVCFEHLYERENTVPLLEENGIKVMHIKPQHIYV